MAKDGMRTQYQGLSKTLVRKQREAERAETRRRNRERRLGSDDVFAKNRNYSLDDQNVNVNARLSDRLERGDLNRDLIGPPGSNVKITATEFRTNYPERVVDIMWRPGRPYYDYVDPVYGSIAPEPPINRYGVQGWDASK